MIRLLLLPSIAAAFSPGSHIMTKSPVRRTSSVAYDDQSHGPKYSFHGGDAWRARVGTTRSLSSSAVEECSSESTKPMFSFGILTDIQYAPIADGHSYNGTPRYYRHAVTAAEYAARHFEEEKVQCVLNLGDIIDGKCADVQRYGVSLPGEDEKKLECSADGGVGHQAVDDVLKALSLYKTGRVVHTYGENIDDLINLQYR